MAGKSVTDGKLDTERCGGCQPSHPDRPRRGGTVSGSRRSVAATPAKSQSGRVSIACAGVVPTPWAKSLFTPSAAITVRSAGRPAQAWIGLRLREPITPKRRSGRPRPAQRAGARSGGLNTFPLG